jgi:hypothetical protein
MAEVVEPNVFNASFYADDGPNALKVGDRLPLTVADDHVGIAKATL